MNLSMVLFLIGILGFILNRKNIILMLLTIEMMLLAVTKLFFGCLCFCTILFMLFVPSCLYCDPMDLMVIPDILPSNVGTGRFTRVVSASVYFTPLIKGVIIGLILSDATIQKSKPNWNARLIFEQSLSHFQYFWFVFSILSHYCLGVPYSTSSILSGLKFPGLAICTRALPCFTELYHLFYIGGVKVIPSTIFDLLTPVALAHWIMGDGSYRKGGLLLCTDSYTIPECVLLINVLMIKFGLDCTLQMFDGKPRIYIKCNSVQLLRPIVLPYMQSSMLYKLGL